LRLRIFGTIFILLGLAAQAHSEDEGGWFFSGRFSGSSNSAGMIMKADPLMGYRFNRHFQTYVGLPVYFTKESSTLTTSTTATTQNGFLDGIGNAYVGLRLGVDNPALNFASSLVATAPTGDKTNGFSTGRATVDWTNTFSHKVSVVTPFADIGLANTVSDTSFFVRPFTSLGFVGHFDGGARIDLSRYVDVGASAYAVRAAGQQTIISKIVGRERSSTAAAVAPALSGTGATASAGAGANGTGSNASGQKGNSNAVFETASETVGSSSLANDHGFSTWFGVSAGSNVDFQVGYTRSAGYDLNTIFASVGFRFGK
jgi:hypothetical protein